MRTDGRTDGDAKLKGAFQDCANAPKKKIDYGCIYTLE
jgi:hypothetical protein